jgi:diaminopimelate epimerase
MQFTKYHALGNDYLVLTPEECTTIPGKDETIRICHRNFGLGSDGILYGPLKTEKADFGLRILNPDGSEAEKSGNGLRIFCRFLFDNKLVEQKTPFTVDTLGGIVTCTVHEKDLITVEMGRVTFDSEKIPASGTAREMVNQKMTVKGTEYSYCCGNIGNPHCVLPLDEVSKSLACEIGPIIENNTELFPERINIQLLKVIDRNNIQIEIWERGAGYTLASGSSSSAAGSAAKKLGLVDEDVTVHMPGGIIKLHINDAFEVTMTGSVTSVGSFSISDECLNWKAPEEA